ncbi:MAG: hypothetical protein GTO17_06610 [Candidatus Aminicenantes bacterium]|nr:hypothetical protein [Candidatus Aminicenantes bacterium]
MIFSRNIFRLFSFLFLSIFIFLAFYSTPLQAQKIIQSTDPELRLKWYKEHVAMKEKSLFKHLPWQFVGPTNISGRCTDVAVVAPKGKYYTMYAAAASGGVWKTVNEGTTWEQVFKHGPSTSVGDVTIAPSDHKIVWIGLGEANIFRSSMAGAGVYKSTDEGKTWKYMGLAGTHTIPRIVIHPENPDIVYVAASGHEWTDNEERGVYKTTDGGKTWEKIFYIDEKTGAIDLVMDPSDSDTLYVANWQRKRKRWNDPRNEPGYSGSGIHKTIDGGKTWVPINEGLPPARYRGRIGIDIARSNPNVLYAFVDNYEIARKPPEGEVDSYGRPRAATIKGAEVYRTDDKGKSWRKVSQSNQYMERLSATYGWVFGQMRVDPNDENTVYVMGLALNQSTDGGKTFRPLYGMHGDHHGLWIDPNNSKYLFNANDGGVSVSYDFGETWRSFTDNLPAVQFFNIAYDMDKPFHVYGSIQDHGSRRGIVELREGRDLIPAVEFEDAPGGEGCSHAIDPDDPNIVFSAGFYGRIQRSDYSTGEWKTVRIVPRAKKGEPPLRGQWVAPFILSPHNPRIIYHGMQYLFRSMNRGDTWERISPDLTYNDPDKMGDIPYQTIFAISESPLKFGLIYVGTDDGKVHVTKNGGVAWSEIMDGLPYKKWVSRIEASAYDEGTVYMSQNGKRHDDFAAYLWKSTDYGKTWEDMTGNIPCGPINVIREDPKNKNVLYVGTDLGVYVSIDGGKSWQVLANNLPTTFVHDLRIHPRDDIMVIGTHGRGVWALDVSYIQKCDEKFLAEAAHLFKISPARLPRWRQWGGKDGYIYYFLNKAQKVSLVATDESGKLVKKFKAMGDVGLNRIVWDLRTDEKEYVKSGTYTVKLSVGAVELEEKIKVTRPERSF